MLTRAHVMPYLGQHVVFGTNDGVHHGLLHTATADGILVRPVGGATTRLASAALTSDDAIRLLQNLPHQSNDVQEAWFPFFFFPFLALSFLSPWAWWW